MSLETEKANTAKAETFSRDEIISELKKSLRFATFYMAAGIKKDTSDWKVLAKLAGIPEEEAETYQKKLFFARLWAQHPNRIEIVEDYLNLGDLTVAEYLTMTLNVISQISETGPCRYESLMLGTTQELKREFYRQVDLALKNLVEKSAATESNTLFAWNFAGLDCLNINKGNQ